MIELKVIASTQNPRSACLVYDQSQKKFLVLKETLSKKWTLPYNLVEKGTTSKQTALAALRKLVTSLPYVKRSDYIGVVGVMSTEKTFVHLLVTTTTFAIKLPIDFTKYVWVALDEVPSPMDSMLARIMRDRKIQSKIESVIEVYN